MVKKGEFAMKSFLISGAANGIGAEIAQRLLEQGAQVYALDFNAEALEDLVKQTPDSSRLTTIVCDISNEVAVASALKGISSKTSSLDGLVNAAGIVRAKNFLEMANADWQQIFSVNLFGTFHLIKFSTPLLLAAESPRIVNFASMAGKISGAFTAPYAASKAAVISLTRSAAVALAPKINVNSICPGIIETPMWDGLSADLAGLGFPDHFKNRSAQAPLGRPGKSSEVADAALFLLSDAARYITGEDLNVSGGLVMH